MASNSYSRWFSKGAFSFSNRIAVVFFGFLNIFFMVRMMPKAEIGIWVLFTSVTAIMEMIRNGFIRNPFVALLVSADENEKKTVITASLVLHCMLGIVLTMFLLIGAIPLAAFWEAPGLDTLFWLYALNNIIFIPFLHIEYLQTAHSNFKAIFVANFFRLGATSVYIMVLFFLNMNLTLIDLTIAQIIATIFGVVIGYIMLAGNVSRMFAAVNWKTVKELFHFGKYTFGTNISSMFVKSTDSWMIGKLISTAGVAIYNPAIRIANLVEVPTVAIAHIIFPHMPVKMREQGHAGVRELYTKSVSLILAIMLPVIVVLYVFAEEIITIIFSAEYIEAADILRVTVFYTLIVPFNRQFGTVMDSLKNPKINFYLLVMVAILNIIFNYIFLKMFGLIGSAYGTLLSYCIVFVLNQVILYRMYGINTFKVFERIPEWYRFGWDVFKKRIVKFAL